MIDQFRQSTEALPDAAVVLVFMMKLTGQIKPQEKFWVCSNLIKSAYSQPYSFSGVYRYLKSGITRNRLFYRHLSIIRLPGSTNYTLWCRLRLLLAQDITQLKKMERMRKDFVANVSMNSERH